MKSSNSTKILVLLAIASIIAGFAYFRWSSEETPTIDFNNYQPLAMQIREATEVTLYEGLPHQYFEKDELAAQRKNKQTVTLHGYPFYREKLPLTVEDGKKLKELFCDGKSLRPNEAFVAMGGRTRNPDGSYSVASKTCGGFHPDYCIEWKSKGETYQVLVCFGCAEMKCYGPKLNLYCDFEQCGETEFGKVLQKYRKNRPARNDGRTEQPAQASAPGSAKVKILAAIEELPPHYQFKDASKFKVIEFPANKIRESIEDTITSFDQIKGKTSRHSMLRANEPIYVNDLEQPK